MDQLDQQDVMDDEEEQEGMVSVVWLDQWVLKESLGQLALLEYLERKEIEADLAILETKDNRDMMEYRERKDRLDFMEHQEKW